MVQQTGCRQQAKIALELIEKQRDPNGRAWLALARRSYEFEAYTSAAVFAWGVLLLANPRLFISSVYSQMADMFSAHTWGIVALLIFAVHITGVMLRRRSVTLLGLSLIMAWWTFLGAQFVVALGDPFNTGTAVYGLMAAFTARSMVKGWTRTSGEK